VDQYNELYALVCERAHKLRTGAVMAQSPDGHLPTVDVGAMINTLNFDHLRAVMEDANDAKATIDVGGGPYIHPYHEHGTYYTPTVVGDPDPSARIAKEERAWTPPRFANVDSGWRLLKVFAPVALIMTYENIDEAIEIANSTRYGLGASVFGTNQDECFKIAEKLECGMVSVNDFAVFYVSSQRFCPWRRTDLSPSQLKWESVAAVFLSTIWHLLQSRSSLRRSESERLRPLWWTWGLAIIDELEGDHSRPLAMAVPDGYP
jgi:acyl-CoA reductase-like NAD-dependent aldehyde dehydrogenase